MDDAIACGDLRWRVGEDHESAGLARAQAVARKAAAAGLTAYGGDMFETGLAHLAGAHMIAATPEIGLGCEFYQAKYFLAEDLLAEPFPIEGGHVVLPTGRDWASCRTWTRWPISRGAAHEQERPWQSSEPGSSAFPRRSGCNAKGMTLC